MNARKARALRQAARRMTAGLPSHKLVSEGGRQVAVPTGELDAKGRALTTFAEVAGTARHAPTCTRAVYQKLKRVYGHTNLGTLK
ncbi:hypothetical protein [Achromobacter xylosoxidans]|uniref:hypothetical protein n=1 Tax=Alcaligenes xylosoxydans xylosoxydans TaxID=85698 RepID=UPI001EEA26A2|nr:hypothetical protein [Achromobacter xylosoxidans]